MRGLDSTELVRTAQKTRNGGAVLSSTDRRRIYFGNANRLTKITDAEIETAKTGGG